MARETSAARPTGADAAVQAGASTPVRIAVVGAGGFGSLHARTLAGLKEARLTALCDPATASARPLADALRVPHVASLEELIEGGLAEAVVIASPTETHASLAVRALEAGLHVLVEKPVGTTADEVLRIESARRQAGRAAMAGHVCLFHSLVWPLLERVRAEGFRSAHFVRHRPAGLVDLFPGVHPISMTMVHDLAVLCSVVRHDEPVAFEAWDSQGPGGAVDHAWAMLRWTDGRTVTLHSHWILPPSAAADGHDWVEFFGRDYHTRVATNPQSWTWCGERLTWPVGLEISEVRGRPTGMLAEELRCFLEACRGGDVPVGCRIEDAARIQRWMEILLESAKRSRSGPVAGRREHSRC